MRPVSTWLRNEFVETSCNGWRIIVPTTQYLVLVTWSFTFAEARACEASKRLVSLGPSWAVGTTNGRTTALLMAFTISTVSIQIFFILKLEVVLHGVEPASKTTQDITLTTDKSVLSGIRIDNWGLHMLRFSRYVVEKCTNLFEYFNPINFVKLRWT